MDMVHITIQTSKFDEEIDFYEKFVGLKIQRDMRPVGKELVFLGEKGEVTLLEVIRNEDAPDVEYDCLSIGFEAHDIDATREKLEAAGMKPSPFITPTKGVKFFYVKDPAGMKVQFIKAFYL